MRRHPYAAARRTPGRLFSIAVALILLFSAGTSAESPLHLDVSFQGALQGFALGNEPISGSTLQDDTGLIFNAYLNTQLRYRHRAVLTADLALEGQSRYGLLLSGDRQTLFRTLESVESDDLAPFFNELSLRLNGPAGLSLTAGIIRWLEKDKYANPGVTLALDSGLLSFQAHYSDVGKRSGFFRQPKKLAETPEIPGDVDADYFGAQVMLATGGLRVSLIGEWLRDRTPADKRWNLLEDIWGDIRKDDLGTVTGMIRYQWRDWDIRLESARNFGSAETVDGDSAHRRYTGSRHEGWVAYRNGAVRVRFRYVLSTGNPWPTAGDTEPDDFEGFAAYPPTDLALYDSHYARHEAPPVLTGGTLTPYYGIPRPGWYIDSYSLDNLETYQLTLRFFPLRPLALRLDTWLVRADTVPPISGKDPDSLRYPSKDLGLELDAEAVYSFPDHVSVRAFFGAFRAGDYYDDASGGISPLSQRNTDIAWLAGKTVTLAELGLNLWF